MPENVTGRLKMLSVPVWASAAFLHHGKGDDQTRSSIRSWGCWLPGGGPAMVGCMWVGGHRENPWTLTWATFLRESWLSVDELGHNPDRESERGDDVTVRHTARQTPG